MACNGLSGKQEVVQINHRVNLLIVKIVVQDKGMDRLKILVHPLIRLIPVQTKALYLVALAVFLAGGVAGLWTTGLALLDFRAGMRSR